MGHTFLSSDDLINLVEIYKLKVKHTISKDNNYMKNLFRAKLVETVEERKGRELTRYVYRVTEKGENYIKSLLSIKVEY